MDINNIIETTRTNGTEIGTALKGIMKRVYTEDEITEAYEDGRLFVKCLNTVADDEDIYCYQGKEYEILDETNTDCWIIECDLYCASDKIQIAKDDEDFELIIK